MFHFFFAHKSSISRKYKEFFGGEEEVEQDTETDTEEVTQIPPSQATARFYFQLNYQLAKEDLTKFHQIEEMSVYLCLNTASLIKDRIISEQNEMKKLKNEMKSNR
jgi:hypothetical protein